MTKKVPMVITAEAISTGVMILISDKPAAFIAISSLFSPICPMVIIAARRVARGRARGRTVQLPHQRNSAMTLKLSPLPTSSSM